MLEEADAEPTGAGFFNMLMMSTTTIASARNTAIPIPNAIKMASGLFGAGAATMVTGLGASSIGGAAERPCAVAFGSIGGAPTDARLPEPLAECPDALPVPAPETADFPGPLPLPESPKLPGYDPDELA